MYFKYREQDGSDRVIVREVKHFTVDSEPFIDEDGVQKTGGTIVVLDGEAAAEFADGCIHALCELQADNPRDVRVRSNRKPSDQHRPMRVLDAYSDSPDWLAFYDTEAEAQTVFSDICKALSEGKLFYDLTAQTETVTCKGGEAHA